MSKDVKKGIVHLREDETPPLSSDGHLLTVEEVADLFRVSPRTIYGWVSQGRIPFYKIGRCVRFSRTELFAWTRPSDRQDYLKLTG